MCEFTGMKQYSRDVPQGGIEIPCVHLFPDDETDVTKLKKFMSVAFSDGLNQACNLSKLSDSSESEPAKKKRNVEKNLSQQSRMGTGQWLQFIRTQVTFKDKDGIISGAGMDPSGVAWGAADPP